jgi:hypothetical protein
VREFAMAALGSVVAGAGATVRPYAPRLFAGLLPLTALAGADALRLRGYAIECLGLLALSAGADAARLHLPAVMDAVAASFPLDASAARERAFIAVNCLAEAFGEELAPFVPALARAAAAAAAADIITLQREASAEHAAIAETVERLAGSEAADEAPPQQAPAARRSSAADDDDGGGDDDDSDDAAVFASVNVADVDAKKAALTTLGFLAKHCPASFAPHLLPSIAQLVDATREFSPTLRSGALLALANCVSGVMALARASAAPAAAARSAEDAALALPAEARAALDTIMLAFVTTLKHNSDAPSVATACVAVRQACAAAGLAAVAHCHAPLMRALLRIACGRARCQRVDDAGDAGGGDGAAAAEDGAAASDDGGGSAADTDSGDDSDGAAAAAAADPAAPDGRAAAAIAAAAVRAGLLSDGCASAARLRPLAPDDDDLLDAELFDEATDAVVAVAGAMREHFAPRYLPAVVRAWTARAAAARPPMERVVAAGLWGELAQAVGGAALAPYLPELLPRLCAGATDASAELRRNCLFALGCLAERTPPADFAPALPAFFAALAPSLAAPRPPPGGDHDAHAAADNAAAALCKAISAAPAAVPLAQALPPLLALLPLAVDFAELRPVFAALLHVAAAAASDTRPALPRILALAADALGPAARTPPDVARDVIRPGVRAALHAQRAAAPQDLARALAALTPAQRAAIDDATTRVD